MENINCNLCRSWNLKSYKKIDDWQLVKCRRCGLVYLNPRPSEKEMQKKYNRKYYQRGIFNENGTEKGIAKEMKKRSGRVDEILRVSKKKKGKLLDIGCGPGFFIALMKKKGWEVKGLDLSGWAVDFAREKLGLDVYQGRIEEIEFKEKFDVITMYHLLEHLPDPLGSLKRVSKIITDNGILVIKGPNFASFDRIWHGKKWWSYDLPFHLYHFTPKTYCLLIKKAGFIRQEIRYESFNLVDHLKEAKLSGSLRADHSKGQRKRLKKDNPKYLRKIFNVINSLIKSAGLNGRDLTIYARKEK